MSTTSETTPGHRDPVTDRPPARALRTVVLAAVFVCAACGLVYELALVTLGSYLLGNSITQTAVVISVTMFAMGLGAIAAKPLLARPLFAFVGVELALAVVGGFSVPLLYAAFAWLHFYTPMMVLLSLLIGLLIGAEIPLLMELLQRLRAQDAARAVADINAVDYIGALVGGLAFPFLLLPAFGLLEGTLVVAACNVVAAWVVSVGLARRAGSRRLALRASVACVLVAAALLVMAWRAAAFEASAQQALFRDPIIHSARSAYQSIVLTRGAVSGTEYDDVRLFLDGDLQFSSVDEYRYHEMLVHPAMNGAHRRVLVLGGGDGLALREVLRTPGVEEATLVDLDPAVVDLAKQEPIRALNADAWSDPRVTYVAEDAFGWIRRHQGDEPYDVVIADFPDPDGTATAKLYTVELYGMLRSLLTPQGRLAVQAGSPFFAPDAFWSIRRTVQAAGFETVPYQADVPSFGNWGFVLAGRRAPELALAADAPTMRFASNDVLTAAQVFPADRAERDVEISTLLDPAILDYSRSGWVGY